MSRHVADRATRLAEAREAERQAIAAESPLLNRQHNPSYDRVAVESYDPQATT